MEADFFIVGQGLAGSLLAFELLKRNKSILVFDDPKQHKASEVAAGLINPVVFRRMTKSWLVDEAFPLMEDTYQQIEVLLKQQFYFPEQTIKILSEESAQLWESKIFANNLQPYLEPKIVLDRHLHELKNPLSFGLINKSGRFHLNKFINQFKKYLKRQDILVSERFDCEKLRFNNNLIFYDHFSASKVIFCEGSAVSSNPFFRNLKFKHSKGEVLVVEIPDLNLDRIINDEVFVMPIGIDRYKIGATYSWDPLDWEPTENGRSELVSKVSKLLKSEIRIVEHKAGIRPTMHDRKPVIGLLPNNTCVGIFNGLGSKGVLMAPYFARQMAEFLIGESGYIHPEADIKRYYR